MEALHRVAVELGRDDPWPHRGERVVSLADEPVGALAEAARRTAASIGHVVVNRVPENVVPRLVRRHIPGGPANYDPEFYLPIDAVPTPRQHHFILVADDRSTRGLVEQVRNAAVRHALGTCRGPLLGRARLAGVAEKVH